MPADRSRSLTLNPGPEMPENVRVLFHPMQKSVTVPVHSTVLEALRQAGIPFESICGGKGECNKCRVIFLSGSCTSGSPESIRGLSPKEVEHRYCRACQTFVTGNCEFAIPVESRIDSPHILQSRIDTRANLSPVVSAYLVVPAPQERSTSPPLHPARGILGHPPPYDPAAA